MAPINRYNPSLARQAEMEAQGYGSYSRPAAPPAQGFGATISPWMQAAGIGLDAIGGFQANDDAQRAYEMQVMTYNAQRDREARMEEEARQQRILDNIAQGGSYAQGLVKNAQNVYGSYARQTGM